MVTIKSYTDLEQSKKLAEILPLESADMYYGYMEDKACFLPYSDTEVKALCLPCWSLASLLGVLPEIDGIPLTLEKVKAEDGYEGYYYHIEYENKILIPYSKNPVDACYEMILKLNELKML